MSKKQGRAANGMGSIRQRPDGRWEARYTAPDGRQHSLYGKTEKDVTARLRGALHELDSGAWREPSKMTVSQWLDIWLADYQGDNSERTIIKYKSIVNHGIKPVIGELKLVKLAPIHIRRLISSLQSRGLSQVTISNYCRILRTALRGAMESRLIKENPAAIVQVSRGRVKKFHIIERAQFPAFIDAAKQTKYENELIFMLYTGLRVGEARGLRWSDVDLDEGIMDVQRQLHAKSISVQRVTSPKYGEERTIHLPTEAVDILRDQRRKQAEQRLAMGVDWHEDDISRDLVFRQPNGEAHGEKTILTAVRQVGKEIGIPDLHPHDLRHSYAVAALRSGADVKTVQHNMGHKKANMTLDVYMAYTEDAGKEGASKLSKYLKNEAE